MSIKYVIRWKSKVNGRAGKGSKEFGQAEGERLVEELNSEYPDIEHDLVEAPPPQPAPEPQHAGRTSGDAPESNSPVHALSFR